MTDLLLIYFGTLNLVTFVLAVTDRVMARFSWLRLPEKLLLALAWFGGSPAAKLAQIVTGHKSLAHNYTTSLHLIVMFQVTLSMAVWGAVFSAQIRPEDGGSILGALMGQVTAEEEEVDTGPKRFGPGS